MNTSPTVAWQERWLGQWQTLARCFILKQYLSNSGTDNGLATAQTEPVEIAWKRQVPATLVEQMLECGHGRGKYLKRVVA